MSEEDKVSDLENIGEFEVQHWREYTQTKAIGISLFTGLIGWLLFDFSVGIFSAVVGFLCYMIAKLESRDIAIGGDAQIKFQTDYDEFKDAMEKNENWEKREAAKKERWYSSKTNKVLNYILILYFILLLAVIILALALKDV